MFAGTFAGLLVIGNLKSIGISNGVDIAQAGLAVSTFAIGNSLGRIAWGAAYDRYGRPCLSLSLLLLSLCVGSLWLVRDPVFFMLCSGAVGFLFGSCFVLYVADLTAEQGSRSVAHVYPFVFLAYGFSGLVGPVVGGWVFDIFSSYAYACMGAGLVALAGSVAVVALNRGSLANGQIAVTEKEAAGITG
jgi:OFA family oxalate/formate antiporter-like MFS transporter